jgi:RNA polymerase sigma-70 factor (ECF subfamily)
MDEFEVFYRGNLGLVLALARTQGADPDQAEDLAQETFYRAWRHFERLACLEPPAQRAWLVRTLRHLAIDQWRHESAISRAEQHLVPAPMLREQIELRLDLVHALRHLEETDRMVMLLRFLLQMNSREIGEALRLPEGTVRFRLARGRKLLAEQLPGWN